MIGNLKTIRLKKCNNYCILSDPVTDHVSSAAYRMEQRALETLVDLGTQSRNMHVDDVGLRIEMIVPDVLQKHGSRHHLAGMLHQIFQQPELARLQGQFVLAARHPMRQPVELEIADTIGGFLG